MLLDGKFKESDIILVDVNPENKMELTFKKGEPEIQIVTEEQAEIEGALSESVSGS